ncbi:MAG: hypothetical protein ACYTEU_13470 [Planctomycetota bacterium]|jgi:hypothetical protein
MAQTLKQIVIDAVNSQPKELFTTADIIKDVQEVMPRVNFGSLRTCFRRDLVKTGLIKKHSKKGNENIWRRSNAIHSSIVPDKNEISAVNVGEAIIDYVDSLKKELIVANQLVSSLTDKLEQEKKEWRQVVEQKNKTIGQLNNRITALNQGSTKTFSFNTPRIKK